MRFSVPARHRWSVLLRALAATVGGYGFVCLLTAAISVLLPAAFGVSPVDAVLGVTMGSFLFWALIVMAVFHARSARRAWTGVLLGALICSAILMLVTGKPLP
jgi:hypothetical protein